MQIPQQVIQGTGYGFLTSVVLISPCQSVLMAAIYFEMYQKNKNSGLIETEARKEAK